MASSKKKIGRLKPTSHRSANAYFADEEIVFEF